MDTVKPKMSDRRLLKLLTIIYNTLCVDTGQRLAPTKRDYMSATIRARQQIVELKNMIEAKLKENDNEAEV